MKNPFLGLALVAATYCGVAAGPAQAFDLSPRPAYVAEYFNTLLGHYFYTPHFSEQAYIDAGMAGPGWVRTGLGFGAWRTPDDSRYLGGGPACNDATAVNPCQPVTRFYGTPGIGPNSHFFTGFAAEAAALASPASGWSREGISFYVPLPDAQGRCAAGLTPVYRLYNNRWMHNDSNHRFAVNVRARALLREAGWTEEGVAFCAYSAGTAPVDSDTYQNAGRAGVVSHAQCRASASGSCIGLFNLGLNLHQYGGPARYEDVYTDAFNNQVGWDVSLGTVLASVDSSREIAAANTFIHFPEQGDYLGFHLNAANRLDPPLTAITPLRKAARPARPGEIRYGTEYELRFDFSVGLNKIVAGAGGAAYGASSVEFRDVKSGRKFQFNALVYGTMPAASYLGPDAKTGVPIVGVSFGAANPYSRLLGSYLTERTAPGRASETYRWRFFSFNIDGDEFASLVRAARSVDGALSADPRDYVVDNFGIVNEVAGDGAIAGWMQPPTMWQVPRD